MSPQSTSWTPQQKEMPALQRSSSSSDSCSSYSLALTARALLEDAAQPPAHAFDVAKIALEVAGGLDATAAERGVRGGRKGCCV